MDEASTQRSPVTVPWTPWQIGFLANVVRLYRGKELDFTRGADRGRKDQGRVQQEAALVIFALPHVPESWIDKSTDPTTREAARIYYAGIDAATERQAKALEEGVPTARVVRVRGAHYIFLSNEWETLRETRAFLAGLK